METTFALQEITGVPKDYEDLFYNWRGRAIAIIRKVPGLECLRAYQVEDLADTLIGQFVIEDYLNPEAGGFRYYEYEYTDKKGIVQFNTFFTKFCLNRLWNLRDRRNKALGIISIHVTDDEEGSGNWREPGVESEPCSVELVEVLQEVYSGLRKIAVSKRERDLAGLFMFMVKQIGDKGECTVKDIARRFRITTVSARNWVKDLSHCEILNVLF